MKRGVLTVLALVVSVLISGVTFAENLKKGDVVFAKYSMRGHGKELFWHNMKSMPVLVPAGTELKVLAIGPEKVVLGKVNVDKADERIKFQMLANTAQWDKYFVMDKKDSSTSAENADIKEGMSKEEVYLTFGCPSYTGYGVKSYFKSMQEIMSSDTWYYNATTRALGVLIKFSDGKVKAIENYKAGKK
jgi:hypothetical protein